MSLFCLLWIPLFYFFRRSIAVGGDSKAPWAFLLGCAAVIARFFTGPLVTPVGFGFSRWMSGFVDIVSFPVIVPLAVCLALVKLKIFSSGTDLAGFILVWLIPAAAYYSVLWGSPAFPHLLIIAPLLWTAQCINMAFLIDCISRYKRWYIIVLSVPGIAAVPVIAASCWWAFFSQQAFWGFALLFVSLIPAAVLMAIKFCKKWE